MQSERMQTSKSGLQTYPVGDFYLAAFLIASGFALVRAELAGQNRVLFLLRDAPQRAQVVAGFYGGRRWNSPRWIGGN